MCFVFCLLCLSLHSQEHGDDLKEKNKGFPINRIRRRQLPELDTNKADILSSDRPQSEIILKGGVVLDQFRPLTVTETPTFKPTQAPTYGKQDRNNGRIRKANTRAAVVVMVAILIVFTTCSCCCFHYSKRCVKKKTVYAYVGPDEEEDGLDSKNPSKQDIKFKPTKAVSTSTVAPEESGSEREQRKPQKYKLAVMEDDVKPFEETGQQRKAAIAAMMGDSPHSNGLMASRPPEQRAKSREACDLHLSDGSIHSEDTKAV